MIDSFLSYPAFWPMVFYFGQQSRNKQFTERSEQVHFRAGSPPTRFARQLDLAASPCDQRWANLWIQPPLIAPCPRGDFICSCDPLSTKAGESWFRLLAMKLTLERNWSVLLTTYQSLIMLTKSYECGRPKQHLINDCTMENEDKRLKARPPCCFTRPIPKARHISKSRIYIMVDQISLRKYIISPVVSEFFPKTL